MEHQRHLTCESPYDELADYRKNPRALQCCRIREKTPSWVLGRIPKEVLQAVLEGSHRV
jgi:hypothetical protein